MSTTRSLTEKFANHSQLNDVNPTKSLLICAMPCEVRAAEIYNSTVASIKAEDTHSIALHYLKNGMGKNLSFAKTSTCVLLLLVLMVNQAFLYKNRADNLNEDNHTIDFDFLMFVFFTFALSANLLPNLANTFRYQKAQTACEA
ncbi:MAG: hypothetical protein JO149_09160, partial [Gammaproteobacteria bacterium]|nr:hypothetical protein [Gammaproteobacteria bacterium]